MENYYKLMVEISKRPFDKTNKIAKINPSKISAIFNKPQLLFDDITERVPWTINEGGLFIIWIINYQEEVPYGF